MRRHHTITRALAASLALFAVAAGRPEGAGTPPDETRAGDDAVVCIVSHDVVSVTVRSTKALGNVQLVFADGAVEKFEDPTTEVHEATYAGTGDNLDSPITAVHVKSGDNNHGARGLGALVEDVCAPVEQPVPPTGDEEDAGDGKLVTKPEPTPPAADVPPAPQPPTDVPPAPQPPTDVPPAPQPPTDVPPAPPGPPPPAPPGPPTPDEPVGLPSPDLPPDHAGVPPHVDVPEHVEVPRQTEEPTPPSTEPEPEPEPEPELIVVDPEPAPVTEPEVVNDPAPEPEDETEPTVLPDEDLSPQQPGPQVASGDLERDLTAAPAPLPSETVEQTDPTPAAEPAAEPAATAVSASTLANAGADTTAIAVLALLALAIGAALLRRRPGSLGQ